MSANSRCSDSIWAWMCLSTNRWRALRSPSRAACKVAALELECAACHVEQAGDVAALDQALDHLGGAHAKDIADHAAEFDAGVVEHFVQPVDLRAVHMGQLAAVARDKGQFTQILRGNEAGANQTEAGQHGEPLRIAHIGPFDYAQDRPFDYAQDKLASGHMQAGSAR